MTRTAKPIRSCRVCGCTDDDCSGCIARTGEPCYWVDTDLCSACAETLYLTKPSQSDPPRMIGGTLFVVDDTAPGAHAWGEELWCGVRRCERCFQTDGFYSLRCPAAPPETESQ
jgi:hypothetical protein